jgi:sugar phosphate permease
MYLPCNFLSLWVIENKGLRSCVLVGAMLMMAGSTTRLFLVYGSFWPVFVGHILSLSGSAFLKNPVTKLSNNWFGESERGIATGISIMSGPAGIFISKILIGTIMWNDDKEPMNQLRARSHYEFFIMANALFVTLMIIPSFFLFRDHPPSPPSKIASKIRLHFSFREAAKIISKNKSYFMIFLHF